MDLALITEHDVVQGSDKWFALKAWQGYWV